ncbi:isoaspartyl peptidase/L-asparaginase [Aurantiacibacter sp. MUD11]|uniref:isoaspartyl peptidase/L-asparaginase family protein n=1 Tax=Aurantiacibacter sp. MUD11 TaxID=3003265 RepID=UPI0022AA78E3|nr:isoaspartyl peptidase/L-asparaginase [Aurantiacibacter sp. MUD11]WAT17167.1 isoaspartyl peptidase/L-asparaginase [Aurantiacibacter sp. MUD11]
MRSIGSSLLLALAALAFSTPAAAQEWRMVIHGGAGTIERDRMTPERDAEIRAALSHALETGAAVLADGGSALDAVEATIRVLEDDPNFNAGRGAVFTAAGRNELDASIMDGRTRDAGAVAGVTATRHPISLARAVMEDSPHVMMAASGADAFSLEQGLEQAAPEWFHTDERYEQLQRFLSRDQADASDLAGADYKFGTVGAVALDMDGNLAAGTSTGGMTGKLYGRVGDSPVIGAGTYADNRACAVSATGAGEYYIREGVAHEICARIRFLGETPQQAADFVQAETLELGGTGGVIVLGPDGDWAYSFNTAGMYRGMIAAGAEPQVGIYGDE